MAALEAGRTILFHSDNRRNSGTAGTATSVNSMYGGSPLYINQTLVRMMGADSSDTQTMRNLLNVGARIDQDASVAELGSATIKPIPADTDMSTGAGLDAVRDHLRLLEVNYNILITYMRNNNLLNAYPT